MKTRYIFLFKNATTMRFAFKDPTEREIKAALRLAKKYEAKRGGLVCKFIIKYK